MMRYPGNQDNDLIIIPPFRDAHMHFTREGRAASEVEIVEILTACGRAGIFSLCDMGHRTAAGREAKKISAGQIEVRTALHAISKKGGYGSFLGRPVAGEKEIRDAVKDIAGAGADFIKVINSGVVSQDRAEPVTGGGFSLEELKVICEEAGEKNLAVACHANSQGAIKNAVVAGAASIEHGFFISGEILHMMAGRGTSWTPTIFALLAFSSGLPPSDRKYIEEVAAKHIEAVAHAASIGVRLRVGTDSGCRGVNHGDSFFEELRLFKTAGLSFEEIVSAACMERDQIGKGNFIAVEKDFVSTGKIRAVYRDGKKLP
jgi:imidazolonepropionase-like amidohydrolase